MSAKKLTAGLLLEINRLYWWEEKTTYQIAAIYGVNASTVQEFMRRHGIERRPGGRSRQVCWSQSDLRQLYEIRGLSPKKIAASAGIGVHVVFYWLKKYGITRRGRWPSGGAQKCSVCHRPAIKRLVNGRLTGTRCRLHQARHEAGLRAGKSDQRLSA